MTVLSSYNREEEIILEGYSVEYGGKGNIFGTLCVMDKEEKVFSEEDINYLKSMADILSHFIPYDRARSNKVWHGLFNRTDHPDN
ncbi:signal transduction protein with GAF and PtsI domain [Peribacillus sp. V2I11]|nr:signal transduction protein with GAF and PtsI domain [Peribacillus sp. V2I11]